MRIHLLIITASIAVCFSSCRRNKEKDYAVKIVTEWTGKEVRFPEGIPCTSMGKDTTCVDLHSDNYKIMLYVDSLGCTSCRLKLSEWNKIMRESDTVFIRKPEFVLFFQPKKKDEKELAFIFRQNGFRHPVFVDKENEIGKLNNFPSKLEYQCFLLDKDNKVIIVGNPSLNLKVWELYKRQISGNTQPEPKAVQTSVQAEMLKQNLGTMKTGETYTCTFILTNTGGAPLVIMDIKTTCGCTVPTWSRQPVAPGTTTEIKVEVTPDTPGSFRKTVTVYGNIDNTPLQLLVMGEVTD
ncbi:MAG: DUF1573 domain-containing protein [Prevotellaceae bacterium]|jgi:hypothetical protein|nr:DUF1573 domain-containing protein [Prevotellaceae bacterium]